MSDETLRKETVGELIVKLHSLRRRPGAEEWYDHTGKEAANALAYGQLGF